MSCKVGIVSDIHAYPSPLEEALGLFKQHNVNTILCPGDIAGYGDSLSETVELLVESPCQSILGNHEIWYLEQHHACTDQVTDYFNSLPQTLTLNIEGKSIYMVHASPPASYIDGIRLLDQNGKVITEQRQAWTNKLAEFEYDILIVGHTHQVLAEQLAGTLLINPGSSAYNHSCAILELPEMSVTFYPLSNKDISRTWNWGNNLQPGL